MPNGQCRFSDQDTIYVEHTAGLTIYGRDPTDRFEIDEFPGLGIDVDRSAALRYFRIFRPAVIDCSPRLLFSGRSRRPSVRNKIADCRFPQACATRHARVTITGEAHQTGSCEPSLPIGAYKGCRRAITVPVLWVLGIFGPDDLGERLSNTLTKANFPGLKYRRGESWGRHEKRYFCRGNCCEPCFLDHLRICRPRR